MGAEETPGLGVRKSSCKFCCKFIHSKFSRGRPPQAWLLSACGYVTDTWARVLGPVGHSWEGTVNASSAAQMGMSLLTDSSEAPRTLERCRSFPEHLCWVFRRLDVHPEEWRMVERRRSSRRWDTQASQHPPVFTEMQSLKM